MWLKQYHILCFLSQLKPQVDFFLTCNRLFTGYVFSEFSTHSSRFKNTPFWGVIWLPIGFKYVREQFY